jgi:hypothetical protein
MAARKSIVKTTGSFLGRETPTSHITPSSLPSFVLEEGDDEVKESKALSDSELSLMIPGLIRGKFTVGKVSLPPQIEVTPIIKGHVFRFRVNSTFAGTVGIGGLLGACGGICTTTNSALRHVASSIKIHSLRAWTPAGSASASLSWGPGASAGFTPDSAKDIATPDGVTNSQCVVAVPPRDCLAAMWMNPTISAGSTVLVMGFTTGTILDLKVSFSLSNVYATFTDTITTGVLGTYYYLALDGPASNKIRPLGVPTTS